MSDLTPIRIVDARPLTGFRPWFGVQTPVEVSPEVNPPADAFAQGYQLGRREAQGDLATDRARYRALLASCEALQPEPSEELALLIAEAVDKLVRLTVGEVAIDRDLLNCRAQRAASVIADCDAARQLHVHPDDVALVDTATLPVRIVADQTLEPGSVRLENSSGWIEDGVSVHLQVLREQLGLDERHL